MRTDTAIAAGDTPPPRSTLQLAMICDRVELTIGEALCYLNASGPPPQRPVQEFTLAAGDVLVVRLKGQAMIYAPAPGKRYRLELVPVD